MYEVAKSSKMKSLKRRLRECWVLYVFLLPVFVYLFFFSYKPLYGIQIAFKNYSFGKGIEGSPWVGTKWFEYFFSSKQFPIVLKNTISISLYSVVAGFPIPIIFALILNELPFKRFKKAVQTIAYMPHFLSWVIIYGLAIQIFAPTGGLLNMVRNNIGLESIPYLNDPVRWVVTYILLGVWQSFGWNSIVYLAAIAGISPELYEAASVDGASRFRKIWHITLPGIRGTIVTLLVMALGNIIGSGFDRPFAMQNNLVMKYAEVISTFVYKNGIKGLQFSLTTAVGLFQSVVGVFFLLLANWIARKLGERGIW